MKSITKALILTVGYGQGHYSAACGLQEAFQARGAKVRVLDPCETDTSGLYAVTKAYYRLCVRKMPWLWAMAYAQTDTADWSKKVQWPIIRKATSYLSDVIFSWRPDVVVCTYPLFAYMVDFLRERYRREIPCAVVVTDALEISKPWVKSDCDMLFVPDEHSRNLLLDRYGLNPLRVFDSGFPVKKAFLSPVEKNVPNGNNLNLLYGVHVNPGAAVRQLKRITSAFPFAKIVVLAGEHHSYISKRISSVDSVTPPVVLKSSNRMHELLSEAHVYIGKTGAATMFECYASGVPMLANYALPGQEQGNLELLLRDECGLWIGGAEDVSSVLSELLADGAMRWRHMRNNMLSRRSRVCGAFAITEEIMNRFGHE